MLRPLVCRGCLCLHLILSLFQGLYNQRYSHLLRTHYIPGTVLVTMGNTETNGQSLRSLFYPHSGEEELFSSMTLNIYVCWWLLIYFFSSTLSSDLKTHLHFPLFHIHLGLRHRKGKVVKTERLTFSLPTLHNLAFPPLYHISVNGTITHTIT